MKNLQVTDFVKTQEQWDNMNKAQQCLVWGLMGMIEQASFDTWPNKMIELANTFELETQ